MAMDAVSTSTDHPVRDVIARIDAAWRRKQFEGLVECFHEDAVIVGPGYVEFARGAEKCAESYREFAMNAALLSYTESSHTLRTWEGAAVYTFAWEMEYERAEGPKRETGTDQMVFANAQGHWRLIWRYICFEPSGS
jgi:uncharacterized protein (TIGR02246 family)